MSINRVVISGNLTRDAEVRTTQSGMPVMSLGVAVNDRRRNQQTGEWEDFPNFVDCTMFGQRAQSVSPYLTKGTKVAIEGKLRFSQWEREGQKRSKLEVVIDDLEFMSSRNGGNGGGNAQYQQPAADNYNANGYASQPDISAYSAPVVDTNTSVYDGDIPF